MMARAWWAVWAPPGENGSLPSSWGLLLCTSGLGGKCIFKMWQPFQQNFEGQRLTARMKIWNGVSMKPTGPLDGRFSTQGHGVRGDH